MLVDKVRPLCVASFDARTLDAPSAVKANALTGRYNGKRAATNEKRAAGG